MAETSDNAEPGIVGSRRGSDSDERFERDASLEGRDSEIDILSIGSEDGDVDFLAVVASEDGVETGGEAGVGDGTDVVGVVKVFFV
jgi:hypothetical protein